MAAPAIRMPHLALAIALALIAPQAHAFDRPLPRAGTDAMAQAASPEAIADYRRKLHDYQEARGAFEQQASAYWSAVADKRRRRFAKFRDHAPIELDDYVLTQPPVYIGPKRPINPAPEEQPEQSPRQRKYIPVVADLLKAAADQFQFVPERPANE